MLSRQPSSGYRGGRQKEPPPPMMTEAERLVWERERMKKDNHNISQFAIQHLQLLDFLWQPALSSAIVNVTVFLTVM